MSIPSFNLSTLPPDLISTSGVAAKRAVILLIEDDPVLAEMLRERLGSRSHTVWHAANGAEAEAIGSEIRPDLVIIDLGLPGCQRPRRLRATARTVADTDHHLYGIHTPEDAVLGFKLGADDFVRKPFSTDELEARIEAALRRPSLQAADAPPTMALRLWGHL